MAITSIQLDISAFSSIYRHFSVSYLRYFSYESEICHATVLTNRPLKDGEMFEIRIDKKVTKYGTALSIGLTTVAPSELEFARDMTKNKQGHTWLYSSARLVYQRTAIDTVNGDIDDLEVSSINDFAGTSQRT